MVSGQLPAPGGGRWNSPVRNKVFLRKARQKKANIFGGPHSAASLTSPRPGVDDRPLFWKRAQPASF